MTAGRAPRCPFLDTSLLQLIRPAILLLAAVLASPAAAATLEEQAASAAVLEEETVDGNVNRSVLLSPQAAPTPARPATQMVAATQVGRQSAGGRVAHGDGRQRTWIVRCSGIEPPARPDVPRRARTSPGARQRRLDRAPRRGHERRVRRPAPASSSRAPPTTARRFSTPSSPYAAQRAGPAGALPAYATRTPRGHGSRRAGQPVSPVVVGAIATYADGSCRAVGARGPGARGAGIGPGTGSRHSSTPRRWPSSRHARDTASWSWRTSTGQRPRRRHARSSPWRLRRLWNRAHRVPPRQPPLTVGGVASRRRPEIAVGPTAACTSPTPSRRRQHGRRVRVLRRRRRRLERPGPWPTRAAEGANQFLPAIAVGPTSGATLTGGRVEVVYLDDRDARPGYRPVPHRVRPVLAATPGRRAAPTAPLDGRDAQHDPARAGQPAGGARDRRRRRAERCRLCVVAGRQRGTSA